MSRTFTRRKRVPRKRYTMETQYVVEENQKGEEVKKVGKQYGLVRYDELPEYMKENEYILGHYRSEWPVKEAFFSLFRWHNETINIWTHLIGFLVFLGLTIVNASNIPHVGNFFLNSNRSDQVNAVENTSHSVGNHIMGIATSVNLSDTLLPTDANPVARWPFFVFLSGSMFCLLSSATCHLFCCHSRRLSLFLIRFDYVGIAVMIVASFFPPIYYIFQCDPLWRLLYLAGITVMGVLTVLTLLAPQFSTGAFRNFRAFLFMAMGFSGLIPAAHAMVANWREPMRNVTLAYELAMAVSYVTGTLFYITRVPEKWRPGTFDVAGHSHQIFHLFVVAGALAHYGAALVFIEWRKIQGCESAV
ncbi:hypothetical protein QJS10_CPA02g00217 [Acorus calamus]|uniref:Uncharacterized protein n=1 Tax=Acorus calamus TaxID=4465 RepID=A0AAV9FC01_ACOCL|nr:hypothetical protein QJS10_CPA02g00217 [Acorus calamus]